MKVRFRFEAQGVKVDETIEAGGPEAVLVELRNRIARKIPRIPFTRKDDRLREELDVDGKGDMTPAEFRHYVTDMYNEHIRPRVAPPVTVPTCDAELICQAVRLGMAQFVSGEE